MSEQRVLVLGASGLLGHKVLQVLQRRFQVYGTFRSPAALQRCASALPGISPSHLLDNVDALDAKSLRRAIDSVRPHVLVNCVGVVKQSDAIRQTLSSIGINALLPHQLAQICGGARVRLLHFSTDCVFSGRKGMYSEDDTPDPVDLYGRSKVLGEPDQPGCLTLRTSMIGWELDHHRSLLGWFASQRGRTIKGYRKAIFSGLAATDLAELVGDLIADWPELHGVFHAAAAPISKYELLCRVRDALGWTDVAIEPDDEVDCDRSLCAERLRTATGWTARDWAPMIADLAREWPLYESGVLLDAKNLGR